MQDSGLSFTFSEDIRHSFCLLETEDGNFRGRSFLVGVNMGQVRAALITESRNVASIAVAVRLYRLIVIYFSQIAGKFGGALSFRSRRGSSCAASSCCFIFHFSKLAAAKWS